MKRNILIAIVVTASVTMNAAFALAGATISDKRYWPNEARGKAPDTAVVSSRKAPAAAAVPQVSADRPTSQKSCRVRDRGGATSGTVAC